MVNHKTVSANSKNTLTVAGALDALDGREFVELFRHGTLLVELYKPHKVDKQQPHRRDEVYVIAAGGGFFIDANGRRAIASGDVLFVPAGAKHYFADFTDDFATWVFFYGPDGEEVS